LVLSEILESSFTVLGAGRSGIAIAKFLKKKGIKVFLSDSLPVENLKYFDAKTLMDDGVEYETGGHTKRVFDCDVVIKSPGIPMDNKVIQEAIENGKKVTGEIEAASWFCSCPIIAVTGTNGKTTTTVLTGEFFKNSGFDTKVCGNVGLAFAEVISDLKDDSIVILEVSSYQLLSTETFRPKVAMFLNLTPDHIDWHKSIENYLEAKLRINKNQKDNDMFIFNYDDGIIRSKSEQFKGIKAAFSMNNISVMEDVMLGSYSYNNEIYYFDKMNGFNFSIMESSDIQIEGKHNIYNSLAAIIAAKSFSIKNEVIKDTLRNFKGVEHRIEFVKEINGVKFYNDSKATNLDSMSVALESFDRKVILIMGGEEADNNFEHIKDLIFQSVKNIIAIGESKHTIEHDLSDVVKVDIANTFEEAVEKAFKKGQHGDVILFSPAYKSFDMFDNFEHRGNEFKKNVNQLIRNL
jgi:UDP-N-acetylmuramoylalanine--D-glutamate ligase